MAASVKKAAHDIEARERTDDVLLPEGVDFRALLLSRPVLDGLASAGFRKPSPIQLKAIPLGRCGLDLIVQAKSGTGKTCVFCTVALDSLVLENPATQVLVLAPTREIAVQIHSVLMAIGCAMEGLQCSVFIGGRPVSQDKTSLKKCHVAVGSPGRIKQLIELGALSTAGVRLLVLDEADKLLEEGSFQDQINWIFSSLPVNKQMLALSATYPESLAQHLTRYMREPTFVRLNPSDMGLKGLKQYYKLVQSHPVPHKIFQEKVQHLLELFSKIPFNQALVFSNLHTRAQHLADVLSSKGLPAACISGGLSQDQRLEAMSKLKQYQCRVLISTDLTSRGIDAEKVNLVINLDVPQDWETYMHRIGRAGRFGTQGLAVTYCCHGEEENKMMAIAQKCGVSLSTLPSAIEPGLMDEPCDWDVCTTASSRQLSSRTKKKQQRDADRPTAPGGQRSPEETVPTAGPEQRPAAPAEDALPPPRPPAAATRKDLQDALPKIPPLCSFKSRAASFVAFEEAERDFRGFITAGPGRSVEVIREFRGGEDGDPSGRHRESFMLHDHDGGECLTLKGGRWEAESSPRREVPGSSNSQTDDEGESSRTGGVDYGQTAAAPEPQADAAGSKAFAPPAPDMCRRTSCASRGRAPPPPPERREPRPGNEPSGRGSRKMTEKSSEQRKVREEEEEEEESAEAYWRASYRAWNDYYASVTPFQERGQQSYYSAAHSWMAAYRMNAVYMHELLKH
ncbi:probable ATP-dependent RNA helicase DDX20 [Clinocottus analis]|uniref:probable ATP-dependent RNA helicase DDX20 n=1 Tax=Clinocottus analis TaxID=304258 RepID=UPI0035C0FC81